MKLRRENSKLYPVLKLFQKYTASPWPPFPETVRSNLQTGASTMRPKFKGVRQSRKRKGVPGSSKSKSPLYNSVGARPTRRWTSQPRDVPEQLNPDTFDYANIQGNKLS
jgi:hypothetical protein